jgi:hypothetical protein
MKKSFNIGLVLCAALFVWSCNNNRTYSDMLKAQERAINRLIDENGLEILNGYPSDGVFKDNQFVVLPNGVYFNVIDSGNGNRAVSNTTVFCRFYVRSLIEWTYMDDTSTIDCFQNGTEPVVYKYGASSPAIDNGTSTFFFSTLLFSGLEYVGDSSDVKLIIPFHLTANSSTFKSEGVPLYFSKVSYRFEPK